MTILSPEMITNGVLGINTEFTLDGSNADVAYPISARLNSLTWQAVLDAAGTYEVQVTCNKPATVQAGNAKWFSIGGARTASAQVTIPARITYIRFIRTAGTVYCAFYAA